MRNESERPEAIQAGVARLVGQDPTTIVAAVSRLLTDPHAYHAMATGTSPYGDGHASARIISIVRRHLGVDRPKSVLNDFHDVLARNAKATDAGVEGSTHPGSLDGG